MGVLRSAVGRLAGRRSRPTPAPSPEPGPHPVPPRPALTPGTRAVRQGKTWALVHVVDRFRSGDVLAAHAALVADALAAHDVAYAVISAEPYRRRVIMVTEADRAAALAALRADLVGTATYAGPPKGDGVRGPELIEDLGTTTAPILRVHRLLGTDDHMLSGPELGCDLQFWTEVTDDADVASPEHVPGSLVAPRSADLIPDLVTPDHRELGIREIDGAARPTFAQQRHDHLLAAGPPVDVVYTWVDGSDPAWQARRAAALAELHPGTLHSTAAHDSRYASHDELRYSLRSLDMYADWVRQIFLVTDDQVPPWLAVDHPRLRVVSHRELFGDRGRLPTFNSHAIETQLHHLDGLAENYLYLNDDVFFGRPLAPSVFVLPNGLTRFFPSAVKISLGGVSSSDRPYTVAAKNGRALIERRFGRTVTAKFQHTPHALRRSVMTDLERDFPDEIAATAASQFRGDGDVSVSAALGHYYGYATGRAVPGKVTYAFVDLGRPDAIERLTALSDRSDVDVFCLNDNEPDGVDRQTQARALGAFLENRFPFPSPYEV